MSAVIKVSADASRMPRRVAHEIAEIHVAESDLAGPGVGVEGAAERFRGAVELRKIVAGKDPCVRIARRRADDARALVASDFDVNFVRAECGDSAVEQFELVLSRH